MAEVVLFHHVQGLTDGIRAFAAELRSDGHTVHTPDLFDGELPSTIDAGIEFANSIDDAEMERRVDQAIADVPNDVVYGGFSFGAAQAQRLTQTRPGSRGALLYESCIPLTGEWTFGPWPAGVPVQIHGMDNDPYFVGEGDVDAAREIVDSNEDAELFLYPGNEHYFADSSLPTYDAEAAKLLTQRVLEFLDAR